MTQRHVITFMVTTLLMPVVIACASAMPSGGTMAPTPQSGGTDGMDTAGPTVPRVKGYAQGQQILFIHTEASDPEVAQMLTEMMGSPVLVVPSLAQSPDTMLANVYVFTNGVPGDGPLGFQLDVFDRSPDDPAYHPCGRCTWSCGTKGLRFESCGRRRK